MPPQTPLPTVVSGQVFGVEQPTTSTKAAATSTKAAGFVSWYQRVNVSHPMATRSVSMGMAYAMADATAQFVEFVQEGSKDYTFEGRVARTVSLCIIGCLCVGPLLTLWFDALDKYIPGQTWRPVAKRTALDQIFEAPVMISLIFGLSALLEGRGLNFAIMKIRAKILDAWIKNVSIWVPFQAFNQGIVPLRYRVLCQAIFSYFWDSYLSILSHSPVR